MRTRLITPPASEPVTLAEAKAHLRLETELDNEYVTALIRAAREYVEDVAWRGLVTQTWEVVLEEFPADAIELPRGNLVSVTSVSYVDGAGATQVLAGSNYVVDSASVPGRVLPAFGVMWPSTRAQWDAVVVRYVVGWAVGDVPYPIKQAIKLYVSQMYEQRVPEVVGAIVSNVQFAADALLSPYRLLRWP